MKIKADIYLLEDKLHFETNNGQQMDFPYGQRGMLLTLAIVITHAYEINGCRIIEIHDPSNIQ